MAYVSLSQSFGASKANLPVTITEVSTGLPAVILSSATGGLISTNGDYYLDGSGNLSVFVEGGRTWQVNVDAGASAGPVGLLNSAQVAAGAVGVAGVTAGGVLKDAAGNTVVTGGGSWGGISGTLSDQTDLQAALSGKADSNAGQTLASGGIVLGSSHRGRLNIANAAGNSLTVVSTATSGLQIGDCIELFNPTGGGVVSIASGAGGTFVASDGTSSYSLPAGTVTLLQVMADNTLTQTEARAMTTGEAQAGTSTVPMLVSPANQKASVIAAVSTAALVRSGFGFLGARGVGLTQFDTLATSGGPTQLDGSTAGAAAIGDGGTSTYGWRPRVRSTAAAAAVSRSTGFTQTSTSLRLDSDPGRFPFVMTGAIADANANCSFVMGIVGTATFSTTLNTVEPSAMGNDNFIVGADSTDTNFQIMYNDNAGTSTKVDLGANFVKAQFVMLMLELSKNATGTSISYRVTNLNTGAVASGVVTTGLPRTTPSYNPVLARGSHGVSAAAVAVDFGSMFLGSMAG